MREILFRGKNISGEWAYGSLILEKNAFDENLILMIISDIYGNETLVNSETVGQYTGLCDNSKNGKKIFEGDIVEYEHHGIKERAVIRYGIPKDKERHTMYGWYLDDNHGNTAFLFGEVFIETYNYTVIGNIYDNPELLNK